MGEGELEQSDVVRFVPEFVANEFDDVAAHLPSPV
jgi:hypothetical protein